MGVSIRLMTPDTVTKSDLEQYTLALGGVILTLSPVLDSDDGALWPLVAKERDDPEHWPELSIAAEMLGAPVRSEVVLLMSSLDGSWPLAARFIEYFLQFHRCVIDDSSCCPTIVTPEHAIPRLKAGLDPAAPCPVHPPLTLTSPPLED